MIDPSPLQRRLEISFLAAAAMLIAVASVVAIRIYAEQGSVARISNNNLTFAGSSAVVELLRVQRLLTRLDGGGGEDTLREARLRADILVGRAATLAQGKFGTFAAQAPGGTATVERLTALAEKVRAALRPDAPARDTRPVVAELEELERPLLNLASRANQAGADEVAAGQHKLRGYFDLSLWASGALVGCGAILLALTVETRRRLTASNARLAFLAYHDALTRLPNRAMLMRSLAMREGGALAMLDLDGFKAVNDTHGHGLGDRLLVEVGARLRAGFDEDVLVARLGGDEFAILSRSDPAAFVAAVGRAVARLHEPFQLGETTVRVGASAGVALSVRDNSASDLLARADTTLYEVKRSGKGRVEVHRDVSPAATGQRRLRAG